MQAGYQVFGCTKTCRITVEVHSGWFLCGNFWGIEQARRLFLYCVMVLALSCVEVPALCLIYM